MNKEKIYETLLKLLGFQSEYLDNSGKTNKLNAKDIQTILEINGIDTDTEENLEKLIMDMELEQWQKIVPTVQLIKETAKPIIKINIPATKIHHTYEWVIEKENGSIDSGKFLASNLKTIGFRSFAGAEDYFQLEFNIPLNLEIGYHTLKIDNNCGGFSVMKLIVSPEKCYRPESIRKNEKIFGPKIDFYNIINTQSNHRIADTNDLKNLIKKLALYGADIVGIGPINQTSVDENNIYNPFLPSNRMFLNTLFLNTEEMLKFIEDKDLQVKFLSLEFQEKYNELEKAEITDYKAVFDIKFKKYNLLYQSFRELHLNNNTFKAELFALYIKQHGEKLEKLALFRALQDFFLAEDSKYINWHEWPIVYQNPDSEEVAQFKKNNSELVEFYQFLQWQADLQFGEAGKISYEKKLKVGIYSDLPLCIDENGAEMWISREYFSEQACMKIESDNDSETICCPVLLPKKLTETAYSYFSEIIRSNMLHSGAIKLLDFSCLLNSKWIIITDDNEKYIHVCYPIEDLLGIIALESQRNNCMVVIDMNFVSQENKNLLSAFEIYDEAQFELEKISDEIQLEKYFKNLKPQKNPELDILSLENLEDFSRIAKIPNSTYRLQFNKDFTFNDAKKLIPYLKRLGISHVYASPLLAPRKGSPHGYDVVNHNSINLEAGTYEEFNSFTDNLHDEGIGLILDTVPNHMGIGKENKWWMDVLENGQSSEYAHYFDIDWNPIKKELKGKVLLPVLGDHYGNILTSGQLIFKFNEETGKLSINYYEHEFPLNPSSYPTILEYRLEILKTRLGASNKDFLEYLSIVTAFKNLPSHTSTEYEKIEERNREKTIAFERLSELYKHNYVIKGFIEENLLEFKCSENNPISIERAHNLIEEQAYRLTFWRVSGDEINYRRFFDINDLAAVCVEKPDVFTNTHNFIFNLIENKKIDGLRLDHPDGLLEPVDFYKKLQFEISKKIGISFDTTESNLLCSEKLPFYIVAEKILAPFEKIPSSWAIHGTVGYEFLNSVNGLFVESKNETKFTDFYHKFIGKKIDFEEMVIECKKLIMNTTLTGELNVLSNYLNQISETYLFSRDYTLNSLKNALVEVISCFPVYRTYISKEKENSKCRDYIKWAIGLAKKRSVITDNSIFDFIEQILLLELETDTESEKYKDILKFALKFQQYTGPLMAKGFEDTCFYRYNRLISLNEVGGDPIKFAVSLDEFHQHNSNRMEAMPNSMLASSTHDTKRSEDVRARISLISEFPDEWRKNVKKWSVLNKNKKGNSYGSIDIDKNDEYLIYQCLIGIWPMKEINKETMPNLIDRIEAYILKAVREAKVHTSWVNINAEYEQTICNFIRKILNYSDKHPFWKTFLPFQKKIASLGYLNSISQCILKLSSPGVPDIYQGSEIFRFNLVDPDNRHPVDYSEIISVLEKIQPLLDFNSETGSNEIFNDILMPMESGALKLFFTTVTLNFRNKKANLFKHGKYIPLETKGKKAENIVAFARVYNNQATITVAPRLISNLVSQENPLQLEKEFLGNTKIILPEELNDFAWTDIYTNENKSPSNNEFLVADLLNILPATILYGKQALISQDE